jgi:Raf kinase inhibitor-like YbhB/YbcL family protein
MKIVSPLLSDHGKLLPKFTCDGQGINPPLQFIDVPAATKSLVLIVDDPDAPGGIWVHWVLYNIERTTTFIDEGKTAGMNGTNSFGKTGYGGPCPPNGVHRYFFKLYALDIVIMRKDHPTAAELEHEMEGHILEQAELVGTYKRSL